METGRVIHGRYLLQRQIKQTAFCGVYQGMDQRLQRAVAVKSVLPAHITAYRTALKMTANFSHQHILGLYDLVIEPEALYVVQEYVDGDTFEVLVQAQLSSFEIAEVGWQMCLALMYAGSSSRRVCHGDLTPSALLRDRQGAIRINNFALPVNLAYFEKWSVLGGEGVALLETEMPWGQQSEERKADDTRSVGLLLYQLLTGTQEPPVDGRLRFSRGIPPELCETLARAIVRQHPQNINTPKRCIPISRCLPKPWNRFHQLPWRSLWYASSRRLRRAKLAHHSQSGITSAADATSRPTADKCPGLSQRLPIRRYPMCPLLRSANLPVRLSRPAVANHRPR